VCEALTEPDRDPYRPWLKLLDDEQRPTVISSEAPTTVVWSSLWIKRPDAVVAFELAPSPDGGTALRWTLSVDEPIPPDPFVRHLRQRMNQLINADLRFSFGQ
jgi:hypothetical protein